MEVQQEQKDAEDVSLHGSWLDFDAISPRLLPGQDFPQKTSTKHCNVRIMLPSGWSSVCVCAQGQALEEGKRPSAAP